MNTVVAQSGLAAQQQESIDEAPDTIPVRIWWDGVIQNGREMQRNGLADEVGRG